MNNFKTYLSKPGIYTYYFTQTILNCESNVLPVTLEIETNRPVAKDITVYYGESIPELVASGDSINWYGDPANPLLDSRDRQYYATAKIGDQLWMAENLNYYTQSGSWYYNNDSLSYAEPYGRLYDWNTALNSCPISWHIPSDDEWIELEMFLGMSWSDAHNFGWRGHGIGSKLKEAGVMHWIGPNINATNEFNFNALPAGACHYGTESIEFGHIGMYTGFFTSSHYNSDDTYIVHILDNFSDDIGRYYGSNPTAYSVRCIFNSSDPLSHGNSYKPVYSLPGRYVYYVTQTLSGYESPADTVIFTILPESTSPEAKNITVCENNLIPDLFVEGKNIQWYSDAQLENLVHSGNSFSTGLTYPGDYQFFVTQTIGDYVSKSDTIILTINSVPLAPVAHDVLTCENQPVPNLVAFGENIQWYNDAELNNPVYSGNIYVTGHSSQGSANYYVTQTVLGCEGVSDTVILTILPVPPVPVAYDVSVCEDLPVPELTAEGINVRWYSDSTLTNLINTGNIYSSNQAEPGTYTFYITQSATGCESEFIINNLSINRLPAINLGEDTTIIKSAGIKLGPFNGDNNYLWDNGSVEPYFEISGTEIGLGDHLISVIVTDTNECIYSDSININVVNCKVSNLMSIEACERYTSGSGKYTWTSPGVYTDTIQNAQGCDSIITVYLTILLADTSVTKNMEVLTANVSGATYQWINCDNSNLPIGGETHQTFVASTDGNYAMVVWQNGCVDTSECFIVHLTDISDQSFKQNITIYPNPNDGSFYIDLGKIYPQAEIAITELDGRIIQIDKVFNSQVIDMQIAAFPGMYLVNIVSGNERAVFKILKE